MRHFWNRSLSWMTALLLITGLCGCSSFHRDWKQATQTSSQPSSPMEGAWEGTWKSEASGHHGRLRCLLSNSGPTSHLARFRANYAGIFTFEYSVPLQVTQVQDGYEFKGEANLGWLAGGAYQYGGRVQTNRFFSTYRSKADHGVFQLNRPPPPISK